MNQTQPANPHDPSQPYFPCVTVDGDFVASAPVTYEFTVDLPVSPDTLFDVFEDPASWPKWAMGIGRVQWTSPKPYGVGTTRTVFFWGGMQVYEVFTDWKRGERMAFQFTGTTQLVWTRFGERYEVQDTGNGTCRLTWTVAYEPTGGFARWHRWIQPVMAWNLKGYMSKLRAYCARL